MSEELTNQDKPVTPHKALVMSIYIEQPSGRIVVEGLLGNQQLCLNALGEAIKAVANFNPPKVQVVRPNFLGGIRNPIKH